MFSKPNAGEDNAASAGGTGSGSGVNQKEKKSEDAVGSKKHGDKESATDTSSNSEQKNILKYDIDKAIAHLEKNQLPESGGHCAAHILRAILAGGINISPNPLHAKEYGPFLEKYGFKVVSQEGYSPIKGDLAVLQPYPNGNPSGHITMFGRKSWLSDFGQRDMWSGRGYRDFKPPFVVYRWEQN